MSGQSAYSVLNKINSPVDLRKLNETELIELCNELREFILDVVCMRPGHLGASLGVIELTVALHYVFNTPYDKLVWDVGHQSYAHKILTGRREVFHTFRSYNGISGFPKMSESEYDAFGTGHSSTSISAALGMAIASKLNNENDRHHIAVIGDGAMTGGMALEALNNAGISNTNLIVILNDNGIAIDKNVGALKEYLTDITTSRTYNKFKDRVWQFVKSFRTYGPKTISLAKQIQNGLKSSLLDKSNLFEAFNFRYFGPIDGNDIGRLIKVLNDLKQIPGPKLLHCITVKGKGFYYAEKEQTLFHAPGIFDKHTGDIIEPTGNGNKPPNYQVVFGKTIIELAEKNPKIVGITPAMPTGSSLNLMMEKMPERAFDVGIAEQHAVTYAAGLATQGYIPFCNIYSTFMQRGYDQLIHDVALQKLQVVFCLDRAGLVGEDGPTHHGAFDLAFLRIIPNLTISAPMNEIELRNLMYTAQLNNKGPFVIRYPRGKGVNVDWQKPFEEIEIGKGRLISEGNDMAILSIGTIGKNVIEAGKLLEKENIHITHYDMRFLKPLDNEILHNVFKKFKKIITVEDGSIAGGFGSAVIEFMTDNNYSAHVDRLGIPDHFVLQGSNAELQKECGYDAESIVKTIKRLKDL
jgi:1-deoxy-D-xylulose-5-phosphate synthase